MLSVVMMNVTCKPFMMNFVMLNVAMLRVVTAGCCYAECRYAECCYDEYRYAECRYSECRGTLDLAETAAMGKRFSLILAVRHWPTEKVFKRLN
jgi:hypothetical protein